ncbi:aminopeptidase [Mangrovivirga sp. M17]|uniref:Aminopeptidase n=1 Tax=Mangrovivirga halotolerans TaxID=2993936 RepID=A0ABT3RTM9_9BACT|nr:aminopeptidase [Mangrovivirga halotolerans]MCX2745151.1 aminopeptidase [Mangrovivirga halotolerans]
MFFLLLVWNNELIYYGFKQGEGQLRVVKNAKPISELISNKNVADSTRNLLSKVKDIREFAFSELGLKKSDNYTDFYDHGKDPIMFVVSGCKPYQFEAKEWRFPVIGTFSYKGFFDEEMAKNELAKIKTNGYDAYIRTAAGWSTLGFFNDPVLSGMLTDGEAGLSETLIHELFHGTLFIKDSLTFNENLASFFGTKGALKYLKSKYGNRSEIVENYKKELNDRNTYIQYMVKEAGRLNELYKSIDYLPDSFKEEAKRKYINSIKEKLNTIQFENKAYYDIFKEKQLNNAYLMSFIRYKGYEKTLEIQLYEKFDGDLNMMIDHYIKNNK